MKKLFFFLVLLGSVTASAQISLKKGMKITQSTIVKKTVYKLNGDTSLEKGVIEIIGNDIVVDFKNATIIGSNDKKGPDQFYGLAILIKGNNITIKNLVAKGYKVALRAKDVKGLILENCDFSYNYRQHLKSTQEKEDISDWVSYHHNENDEWLQYGAAMYLRGCNNATIGNCKVTGGQNALMMMECNNGIIYNNDFSFNSGVGLGMYKCSFNKVLYNKINFNVRGYSQGVYNRGQDSAGILYMNKVMTTCFIKIQLPMGATVFFFGLAKQLWTPVKVDVMIMF